MGPVATDKVFHLLAMNLFYGGGGGGGGCQFALRCRVLTSIPKETYGDCNFSGWVLTPSSPPLSEFELLPRDAAYFNI